MVEAVSTQSMNTSSTAAASSNYPVFGGRIGQGGLNGNDVSYATKRNRTLAVNAPPGSYVQYGENYYLVSNTIAYQGHGRTLYSVSPTQTDAQGRTINNARGVIEQHTPRNVFEPGYQRGNENNPNPGTAANPTGVSLQSGENGIKVSSRNSLTGGGLQNDTGVNTLQNQTPQGRTRVTTPTSGQYAGSQVIITTGKKATTSGEALQTLRNANYQGYQYPRPSRIATDDNTLYLTYKRPLTANTNKEENNPNQSNGQNKNNISGTPLNFSSNLYSQGYFNNSSPDRSSVSDIQNNEEEASSERYQKLISFYPGFYERQERLKSILTPFQKFSSFVTFGNQVPIEQRSSIGKISEGTVESLSIFFSGVGFGAVAASAADKSFLTVGALLTPETRQNVIAESRRSFQEGTVKTLEDPSTYAGLALGVAAISGVRGLAPLASSSPSLGGRVVGDISVRGGGTLEYEGVGQSVNPPVEPAVVTVTSYVEKPKGVLQLFGNTKTEVVEVGGSRFISRQLGGTETAPRFSTVQVVPFDESIPGGYKTNSKGVPLETKFFFERGKLVKTTEQPAQSFGRVVVSSDLNAYKATPDVKTTFQAETLSQPESFVTTNYRVETNPDKSILTQNAGQESILRVGERFGKQQITGSIGVGSESRSVSFTKRASFTEFKTPFTNTLIETPEGVTTDITVGKQQKVLGGTTKIGLQVAENPKNEFVLSRNKFYQEEPTVDITSQKTVITQKNNAFTGLVEKPLVQTSAKKTVNIGGTLRIEAVPTNSVFEAARSTYAKISARVGPYLKNPEEVVATPIRAGKKSVPELAPITQAKELPDTPASRALRDFSKTASERSQKSDEGSLAKLVNRQEKEPKQVLEVSKLRSEPKGKFTFNIPLEETSSSSRPILFLPVRERLTSNKNTFSSGRTLLPRQESKPAQGFVPVTKNRLDNRLVSIPLSLNKQESVSSSKSRLSNITSQVNVQENRLAQTSQLTQTRTQTLTQQVTALRPQGFLRGNGFRPHIGATETKLPFLGGAGRPRIPKSVTRSRPTSRRKYKVTRTLVEQEFHLGGSRRLKAPRGGFTGFEAVRSVVGKRRRKR